MTSNDKQLKTIRGNMFMNTDVVQFDVCIERMVPKEVKGEDLIDHFPDIVDALYEVLTTGPTWEFNPTNTHLRKHADQLEIDKDKLVNFIKEAYDYHFEELDINNNFVSIQVPIELLVANFREASEEVVSKSDYYTVTTLFGEVIL